MKRIFLTLAIVFGGLVSADDYYYNYPTDYYPDQYYEGYYNDYRNAVFSVNWNQFFVQYRLTPFQIDQIMALNNRFASYAAWNAYYRWNPNRWYYDRFYALQNILGPRVFVVYQNVYFRGASPFVYYRNRCVNFYARRYPVRPVYRNVNINVYKIDRRNFKDGFRTVGRNQGMINPTRNNGVRNDNPRSGSNGNMGRIKNTRNEGVRKNDGNIRTQDDNIRNNGIRNENPRNLSNGNNLGGIRNPRSENVRTNENAGIRNQGGIRQNQNSERRIESRSNGNQRNSAPKFNGNSRNSGNRLVSR